MIVFGRMFPCFKLSFFVIVEENEAEEKGTPPPDIG